jgi:exosome complex component RRP4
MDERKLVTPGEKIVEGMDYLPGEGAHRSGSEIRASILGLAYTRDRLVKVIPLAGRYMPKRDDPVIGIVTEVRYSNWILDINSPYEALMMVGDASERFIDLKKDKLVNYFDVGDAAICKIKGIDDSMGVMVTAKGPGLRKLTDGRIIEVKPAKVPRIIGRNASMIKLIKEATGSKLFVGQNGRVWIEGGNEDLAIEVIRKIEREAHTSGLTDRIKEMLEGEQNGK